MATDQLDLGRLLRVRGMVSAVQVEATHLSATALTAAYATLRQEILSGLSGDLREEFERLFQDRGVSSNFNSSAGDDPAAFTQLATEAVVRLRTMEGWIQGLIDQLTLEQRLRMEAEEKAKAEAKPATGFTR